MTMLAASASTIAPIAHPTADAFLLGFASACSFIAALFFLKFWRSTRDTLFLAFVLFFVIQAVSNAALLGAQHPNEGVAWNTVIRFLAVIGLLVAILRKNLAEK
ncbi:MAG TPA: DUF5985 family protein [Terracidiphilus sp.]|jgi:hypothetical protein|nr:DUF5985 family protein [Terracidiphilus sp.]